MEGIKNIGHKLASTSALNSVNNSRANSAHGSPKSTRPHSRTPSLTEKDLDDLLETEGGGHLAIGNLKKDDADPNGEADMLSEMAQLSEMTRLSKHGRPSES